MRTSNQQASDRHEASVARAMGGHRTPQSGGNSFIKGDVVSDDWIFECKTKATQTDGITIKKDWMKKLEEERKQSRKSFAALSINFGDNDNFYILDESTMQYLKRLAGG